MPKSDRIPEVVTAGQETVAVRFPSNPVAPGADPAHQDGLWRLPPPTNPGSPAPPTPRIVLQDMDGIIGGVVDGGAL